MSNIYKWAEKYFLKILLKKMIYNNNNKFYLSNLD